MRCDEKERAKEERVRGVIFLDFDEENQVMYGAEEMEMMMDPMVGEET